LLGAIYWNHPIIHKQNKLRCFCFASPPVLSREFPDKHIGNDYIFSIALSTDFITRLSMESVKHHNLRNDLILECDQNIIDECMEISDDDNDGNLENERIKFLARLKSIDTPNAKEQLFPIGRILWFVPKAVMEDDIERRRKCLMDLEDKKEDDLDGDNEEEQKVENKEVEIEEKGDNEIIDGDQDDNVLMNALSKTRRSISGTWNALSQRIANWESSKSKKLKKYGAANYVLCDGTKSRDIFQELVIDFPESFLSHLPQRYLWVCSASITESDI